MELPCFKIFPTNTPQFILCVACGFAEYSCNDLECLPFTTFCDGISDCTVPGFGVLDEDLIFCGGRLLIVCVEITPKPGYINYDVIFQVVLQANSDVNLTSSSMGTSAQMTVFVCLLLFYAMGYPTAPIALMK